MSGRRAAAIRRLWLGCAFTGALLASWIPAAAARAAAPVGCNPAWPVLAHRAGAQRVTLPAGDRLPVACATATGYPTSESTLAVGSSGALIYSPAQSENSVARSLDGGASWSLSSPAGEQLTDLWNTDDPDVVVDPATGRVFWAHATHLVSHDSFLPSTVALVIAAAYGFQVYGSTDSGASWTTADYSTAPTGDWEKLFVGPPPPASTGAAQPVGYPNVVYLCANSPVEVSGPGRLCYKSLDGGRTFEIAGFASPTASNPADICPPLNFNAGVVDGGGTTYQPVDCQQAAYVLVSHDEGASYTWLAVPGAPTGTPTSGTNMKLAVDAAGNLYAIWTANGLLYLDRSSDHAKSWSAPLMVSAPGVSNVTLPAVAAGARGRLAITYYGSSDPSASSQSAYITQTGDATDRQPLLYSGAINDPAHPIFHDYGLTDSPRADFVGGAFTRAGTSFWAGVVKQLGPPDSSGVIPTTGYVGRLLFSRSTPARLGSGR